MQIKGDRYSNPMKSSLYDKLAETILENQENMYRMAFSILGNDTDSQDAVGESIVRAFENWHRLVKKERARSWLMGIVINVSRELCAGKKKIVLTEEPEKYAGVEFPEDDRLWPVILDLPYEIRIIVVAYYYQGFRVKEIARMLGIAEGTVKTRLSRGRKILAEIIRKESFREGACMGEQQPGKAERR